MKRDNIIYWVTTSLISLAMVMSGGMYLTASEEMREGFTSIGMPFYFFVLLGIAKITGALLLLIPVAQRIKEWAYAGFAFTFIGAAWTHVATETPWISPIVFLIVLGTSYVFWVRRTSYNKQNA